MFASQVWCPPTLLDQGTDRLSKNDGARVEAQDHGRSAWKGGVRLLRTPEPEEIHAVPAMIDLR